ncbi:hypothetical protein BDB00DRAFT_483710 [Zychaea mexicana]|uniref:uncharacterized protein n=1 Tax=Zychaea mexicana TaxID=64656 RepID=UPI0022FE7D6F|nr:uncharacterized protein BDB00DRAFT_483710 [Zychaea mexicana]KAI9491483.1 hypothetical protein BDB00DRAFT_483710 [Zychaea mexicana]
MNPQASYPPPPTPEGWDAVWDPNSQRYYFVQIATGVTQWDPPTGNPGSGGMAMPGTGGSMPMPGTGNDYNNNSPAPYGGSSMPAAHAPYGSSASPAAHAPYGSSASPAPSAASAGESNSYGGGGGPAYNNPTATSMPEGQHQQQGQPGQAGDERGLGTFVQSPMGGALAGSLIG